MNKVASKTVKRKITTAQYEQALERYAKNAQESLVIIAKSEMKIKKEMDRRHEELGNMPKEMELDEAIIRQYCEDYREKLFGESKTVVTKFGTLRFRTNPHSLVLADGVLEKNLIEQFKKKGLNLYIVSKESLDKKKLITDRDDTKLEKTLTALGVSIEQRETFSIELN